MHFAMTAKSLGVSSSSCMPTKWCKKRVVLAVSRTWRRVLGLLGTGMARDLLSVEPLGTHGLARIWRVDVCIVRRICQDVVAGFGGEDATAMDCAKAGGMLTSPQPSSWALQNAALMWCKATAYRKGCAGVTRR